MTASENVTKSDRIKVTFLIVLILGVSAFLQRQFLGHGYNFLATAVLFCGYLLAVLAQAIAIGSIISFAVRLKRGFFKKNKFASVIILLFIFVISMFLLIVADYATYDPEMRTGMEREWWVTLPKRLFTISTIILIAGIICYEAKNLLLQRLSNVKYRVFFLIMVVIISIPVSAVAVFPLRYLEFWQYDVPRICYGTATKCVKTVVQCMRINPGTEACGKYDEWQP